MPRYRNNKNKEHSKKTTVKLIVVLLLVALLFLVFVFSKIFFLPKFTFLSLDKNVTKIVIVDKFSFKPVTFKLNSEIKLNSSRNYGEYLLSNLWILGEKEGLDGLLVTESIARNFSLPIVYWKNDNKTNLSLYQRLKVLFLTNDQNPEEINLPVREDIKALFADQLVIGELPKVKIEDYSGGYKVSENVSSITEVIGFKTVDFLRGEKKDFDCEIYSNNHYYLDLVKEVFKCQDNFNKDQKIDLLIRIGSRFSDRF